MYHNHLYHNYHTPVGWMNLEPLSTMLLCHIRGFIPLGDTLFKRNGHPRVVWCMFAVFRIGRFLLSMVLSPQVCIISNGNFVVTKNLASTCRDALPSATKNEVGQTFLSPADSENPQRPKINIW